MKTDIKSVIHLYIGQEVMYHGDKYIIFRLDCFTNDVWLDKPDGRTIADSVDEVKLIVRRLSSMTEEEKNELDWRSDVDQEAAIQNLGPKEFLWLLSKGFWLFGDDAFDEGLVIEAK